MRQMGLRPDPKPGDLRTPELSKGSGAGPVLARVGFTWARSGTWCWPESVFPGSLYRGEHRGSWESSCGLPWGAYLPNSPSPSLLPRSPSSSGLMSCNFGNLCVLGGVHCSVFFFLSSSSFSFFWSFFLPGSSFERKHMHIRHLTPPRVAETHHIRPMDVPAQDGPQWQKFLSVTCVSRWPKICWVFEWTPAVTACLWPLFGNWELPISHPLVTDCQQPGFRFQLAGGACCLMYFQHVCLHIFTSYVLIKLATLCVPNK